MKSFLPHKNGMRNAFNSPNDLRDSYAGASNEKDQVTAYRRESLAP